jgi:hypothetical protein
MTLTLELKLKRSYESRDLIAENNSRKKIATKFEKKIVSAKMKAGKK